MNSVYERLILEVRQNWHPDGSSGACIDADLGFEAAKEIEKLTEQLAAAQQQHERDIHTLECWNMAITSLQEQLAVSQARDAKLRAALESISKNTCCGDCQEAKLVAIEALCDEVTK